MKNKLCLLLVSLFAMFVSACSEQKPTATQENEVIMGLDDSFPPMGYVDEKGELVGFDIDLANAVAQKANLKIKFKAIDWSAKEAELMSHKVDMLWNGLTITPERKNKLLFSDPYMINHQIIITKINSPIRTKNDLDGKVIAAQEGSSAVDAINRDPIHTEFGNLATYPDNVVAMMELINDRVDALVVDEVVGKYYLTKQPGQFKVLDDHFGAEEYGIAFRKEDEGLRNKIQEAIDELKADGSLEQINQKWFGTN